MISRLRGADASVLGIVWVLHAALVARFWFVTDDAFITFRYARNLVDGVGLRYNAGSEPPVEGYSNFLWLLFAAVFEALGADVTFWVPLVSALIGAVLLGLVFLVARRDCGLPPVLAGVTAASFGLFPPFAVWSTSGLETMALALLIFVAFERLVLAPDGPHGLAAGLAGLALALVRVEGIAWALFLVPLSVYTAIRAGRPARRAIGIYLALVVAGYLVYFAGRYAYFGTLLANTASAKVAFDAGHLLRGLHYAGTQVATFVTPAIVLVASWSALTDGRRAVGLPTLTMAFAVPAWAVVVGGDFMAMGRFTVPALPFIAVAFGFLLADVTARLGGRSAPALLCGAALIVAGLLPGWDVHLLPRSMREPLHFRYGRAYRTEFSRWQRQKQNAKQWSDRGRALAVVSRPGESIVATAIGAVGYYSGLHVYDQQGLVTPEVVHDAPRGDGTGRPGHELRVEPTFFLEQAPTYMMVKGPMPKHKVEAAMRDAARSLESLAIQDRCAAETIEVPADPGDESSFLVLVRPITEGG